MPVPIQTRRMLADPDGIAVAAALLREGRLVAFPTETVYGLGADASSGLAVSGIFAAKGRPSFNPLIAHVTDTPAAMAQGLFSEQACALAAAFWPGSLTLVVPARPEATVSALARAGLPTVALRVPAHPVAQALLAAAGVPVAAPSANRSGRISPTSANHVEVDLSGRVELILDGGTTRVGVESTIVSCVDDRPRLLRPGGIPRALIEDILGCILSDQDGEILLAPGMMASHYAPGAKVRMNAVTVGPGEAVLDFAGTLVRYRDARYRDLSPTGHLAEAAANLFGFMHELDATDVSGIAVAPIPSHDLGEAINDRLRRAAAPRS